MENLNSKNNMKEYTESRLKMLNNFLNFYNIDLKSKNLQNWEFVGNVKFEEKKKKKKNDLPKNKKKKKIYVIKKKKKKKKKKCSSSKKNLKKNIKRRSSRKCVKKERGLSKIDILFEIDLCEKIIAFKKKHIRNRMINKEYILNHLESLFNMINVVIDEIKENQN